MCALSNGIYINLVIFRRKLRNSTCARRARVRLRISASWCPWRKTILTTRKRRRSSSSRRSPRNRSEEQDLEISRVSEGDLRCDIPSHKGGWDSHIYPIFYSGVLIVSKFHKSKKILRNCFSFFFFYIQCHFNSCRWSTWTSRSRVRQHRRTAIGTTSSTTAATATAMGTASIGPSAGAEAAEAEEETTAMAEEGPEEEASDRVEAAAADSEEAEVRIFERKKTWLWKRTE